MQNQMNRTLTILADGESVTGYARARLIGTERLGLYGTVGTVPSVPQRCAVDDEMV